MTSTKHRSQRTCAAAWLCGFVILAGIQVLAQTAVANSPASSSLVTQLTKGLSITPTQARGGAGSLFALAKTRLSVDEFGKVSSAVPGMSGLLKSAPPLGGNSELSSLESSLPSGMGRMAEVAEGFHKLGLSPSMAGKFVPVMTKYVESRGGSSTAALLEKALK